MLHVTITVTNNTLLFFSHHVNPLIGVHHLIVQFIRNEPKAFLIVLWDHYLALCMLALYSGMEVVLMNANPVTGIVLR